MTGTHFFTGKKRLGGAMLRAIRQTEEESAEMQQALSPIGRGC